MQEDHGSTASASTLAPAPRLPPLLTDDRKVVRKIERNPFNRLRSIKEDAEWVQRVASSLGGDSHCRPPVVPNLRCGAWYVPPAVGAQTYCYFKSTDGHAGQWSFSLKRPNLDVARLLQKQGSVIITDSTRRGKSLPDALSKTIPAWCAVLTEASRQRHGSPSSPNASLVTTSPSPPFRSTHHSDADFLHTPSHQVPASEHSQMQQRLKQWVDEFTSSDLPIPRLEKPIVPLFLTRPAAAADDDVEEQEAFFASLRGFQFSSQVYTVVLLSASRRVDLPTLSKDGMFYYTQGSGDDEEIWSGGLTPQMFWDAENHARIMSATSQELPQVIDHIVRATTNMGRALHASRDDVRVAQSIFTLGNRPLDHAFTAVERKRHSLLIHCDGPRLDAASEDTPSDDDDTAATAMYLAIPHGKNSGPSFRAGIEESIHAVERLLEARPAAPPHILIVDSEKGSLSAALATALLSAFYTSPGALMMSPEDLTSHRRTLTKDDVRRRLQWIARDVPDANPSRLLMSRINEVLVSRGKGPRAGETKGEKRQIE